MGAVLIASPGLICFWFSEVRLFVSICCLHYMCHLFPHAVMRYQWQQWLQEEQTISLGVFEPTILCTKCCSLDEKLSDTLGVLCALGFDFLPIFAGSHSKAMVAAGGHHGATLV